jgi:ferritin-like metal-binding protein YciE
VTCWPVGIISSKLQKNNMKKTMDLRDLLVTKLNALYDMENAIIKAVPKLTKAAVNEKLRQGLNEHLEETREHARRLERAHSILNEKPKKLAGDGIRGIIADGEWVVKNVRPEQALDAAIARAAQYVEHYEISGYTGAISWAEELGENEIASLLNQTLQEEVASDEKLNEMGEELQKELIPME